MKLAIGIGGASGSVYARVLLEKLKEAREQHDVSVVFSKNGIRNWHLENDPAQLEKLPFPVYENDDFNAPFASGSGKFDALIICPCSAGLMGRIAHGISDDLISRAADVMLKERKKLILVLRETPLNLVHIENMRILTLAGAIICPAIPSFYSKPETIDELVQTVSLRALELAGLQTDSFTWGKGN